MNRLILIREIIDKKPCKKLFEKIIDHVFLLINDNDDDELLKCVEECMRYCVKVIACQRIVEKCVNVIKRKMDSYIKRTIRLKRMVNEIMNKILFLSCIEGQENIVKYFTGIFFRSEILCDDDDFVKLDLNECILSVCTIDKDYENVFKLLLKDKRTNPGVKENRVIMDCCENGAFKLVKLLLDSNDKRIDISVHNYVAIRHSISLKNIDVLKVLLKSKKILNDCKAMNVIKIECSKSGSVEMMKLLFNPSYVTIDPTENENEMLRIACIRGNRDVVEYLLKFHKVDPSCMKNYCIKFASENNYYGIVSLLLEDERVDATYHHNYAINKAVINGNINIVKLLLKNGGIPSMYALKKAFVNRKFKIVEYLLTNLDPKLFDLTLYNFPIVCITKGYIHGKWLIVPFGLLNIILSRIPFTDKMKRIAKQMKFYQKTYLDFFHLPVEVKRNFTALQNFYHSLHQYIKDTN